LRRIGPGPEMNEVDVRVLLAHARANTGDLEGARTELKRAEALVSHLSGGGASRAGVALERGNLAVRFNRLAEAEQQYARAERLTTNDEVRQAARYGPAVVRVQAGRALAAESFYQRGLVRLGGRLAPGIRWRLHAGLAGTARRRGALSDAVGEFHAAIAEIELSSGGLPLEEHRAAFRADKWDVYVELALVERARGRTEAAFEASEWLRERQMLDLLARGRIGGGEAVRGLASREQDLRQRMADLTRQLEASGDSESGLRDP